jgi:tight adherence protein C
MEAIAQSYLESYADVLVPLLSFVSILGLGGALLARRAARRRLIEERLAPAALEAQDSAAEAIMGPAALGGIARAVRVFAPGKPSEGLKASLARAGFHGEGAAGIYLGSKAALFLAGAFAVFLPSLFVEADLLARIVVAMSAGALLSLTPNLVVGLRRESRRREIQSCLADAVDLLEICVSSGMGLDMAWNAVADEVRRVSDTLADEMALTNLEMHLGASRTAALRHMVERTGVDELGSLVGVLVQSERFGTSITGALRTFAVSMREARSHRAQEGAEKMAVKLIFPMVLCIFPVTFIVLAGPAAMKLFEVMGGE